MTTAFSNISVSPVTTEDPFPDLFAAAAAAFAGQAKDQLWITLHPGWDTPEGAARAVERMRSQWRNIPKDREGRPTTVYLQATIPTPDEQSRRIVGLAIWSQYSVVDGWGNKPLTGSVEDFREKLGVKDLYPDDEDMQRYLAQVWQCFIKDRVRAIEEKADKEIPANFVLDMLAVHPDAQKRGIAGRLTQWGLEEAHKRGGLECTTEGSVMGRSVYEKLGMRYVKHIEFDLGESRKEGYWDPPANVFMRTGP